LDKLTAKPQPSEDQPDGTSSAENVTGVDAYASAEITARIEQAGVTKASMPLDKLLMLGGVAFSLGLTLVVVAGAELFTGNSLIVMAGADGSVSLAALLRDRAATYVSNAAGAFLIVMLVFISGKLEPGGVRAAAVTIAAAKMQIPFVEPLRAVFPAMRSYAWPYGSVSPRTASRVNF
jgi:formate/nitrite transporter FocA (FNT family)